MFIVCLFILASLHLHHLRPFSFPSSLPQQQHCLSLPASPPRPPMRRQCSSHIAPTVAPWRQLWREGRDDLRGRGDVPTLQHRPAPPHLPLLAPHLLLLLFHHTIPQPAPSLGPLHLLLPLTPPLPGAGPASQEGTS